jgi:hypothetical protein
VEVLLEAVSSRGAWPQGFAVVVLSLASPLAACRRGGPETASLTMTWSIDGESSARACAAHRAALIEIVITDAAGRVLARPVQRCFVAEPIDTLDRRFIAEGVSVSLPVGADYQATARLKDASDRAITTPVTATLSVRGATPGHDTNFEFGGAFTNGTGAPVE